MTSDTAPDHAYTLDSLSEAVASRSMSLWDLHGNKFVSGSITNRLVVFSCVCLDDLIFYYVDDAETWCSKEEAIMHALWNIGVSTVEKRACR